MEVKNMVDLKSAIAELERKKLQQKEMLTEQLHIACTSLTPRNFIYTSLTDIIQSPKLTELLVDAGGAVLASIATAILPKKRLLGIQLTTLKKIADKLCTLGKDTVDDSLQEIKTSAYQMCNRFFDKVMKT